MFSGKKKKEQLKAKREKKRNQRESHQDPDEPREGAAAPCEAEKEQKETSSRGELREGEFKYEKDRHGIRSVFKSERKEELEERRALNYLPLTQRQFMRPDLGVQLPQWLRVPSREDAKTSDFIFPFSIALPRRGWDLLAQSDNDKASNEHEEVAEELEKVEELEFESYLRWADSLLCPNHRGAALNVFERNVDVWRQFWRSVEASHVVVLVADARYPILHLPLSLLQYIVAEQQKPCVIVLNKSDLVPPSVLQQWLAFLPKYFKTLNLIKDDDEYPKISIHTFTASQPLVSTEGNEGAGGATLSRRKKEKRRGRWYETLHTERTTAGPNDSGSESDSIFDSNQCFRGMEKASRELREKPTSSGLRTISQSITELVKECRLLSMNSEENINIALVGHPNAGKSSLLNCVRGTKAVSVSSTAGRTKHLQTIPLLEDKATLIDSPGIVFPVFGIPRQLQAIIGTHQVAQTRDPQSCVGYLALNLPLEKLLGLRRPEGSSEEDEWCPYDFCDAYAAKKGFFVKNGKGAHDIHRASIAIVMEAFEGRLPLFFASPSEEWLESRQFMDDVKPFLYVANPSGGLSPV